MAVNDFACHLDVFEGMEPFSGFVENGFLVDFVGQRTDATFRSIWGVDPHATGGREMATAMPAKLVAVDGVPENMEMTRKQFRDNGINPNDHWMIEAAMSGDNKPVLFPIGAPGSGTQNCVLTNSGANRMAILDLAKKAGATERLAQSLLMRNSTDLTIDLAPGTEYDFSGEITFVSALTLMDLLAPFERVDFVEADLQQSESVVFPPAMDVLTKKVRRVLLGTHGQSTHDRMEKLFRDRGWDIVFSYAPEQTYETPHATFEMNDGVITAVNPAVAYRS